MIRCKNCGAEIKIGYFCPECGTKNVMTTESPKTDIKNDVMVNANSPNDAKNNQIKEEIEIAKQKNEQDRLAVERAKHQAEQERLALERAKQETELARIKLEQERLDKQKADEKKAIEAEKARIKEEKIKKKEDTKYLRTARIAFILGIFSLLSLGCFVVPEVMSLKYAFSSKKDGTLPKDAKKAIVLSAISIVVYLIVLILACTS